VIIGEDLDMNSKPKIRILNKLGRDNIQENLAPKGEKAVIRTLSDDEYRIELYKKLQEEVGEFLETPIPEELADILEVIHALAPIIAGSWEELEKVRLAKLKFRGGYKKKIFITEIHEK
jgi:predicted house-cleaning noncanonical NTP pyrophosphatase (MazG superfamily)